ncbi:glycosyltransferase family 2 protein [Nitrospinae bacterium]|nr:glycosyltransferase family 2 protein [Nitrospinota bacterium]
MIQILTILQLILIVAVIISLTLNIVYLVRLQPLVKPISNPPPLSVCVPARNEERGVEACLNSLLNQNYPNFEVIAIDDHSTDRTGDIMRNLAQENSRLKVLKAADLPEGWLGKPFALHQAFKVTRGEYLLFTDADPVFKPTALNTAVHVMRERDLDVLTLMPKAEFGSFWERAVQPVIFGFIASLTQFKNVNDPDHRSAMGFGAFLMFRRSAYEKIGGHEAGKSDVLEDVLIAKRAKRAGLKLFVADAKQLFSIRMYFGLKEIWFGWEKNMFLAMKKSVLKATYNVAVVLGFVFTPYIILAINIFEQIGWLWIGMAVVGVVLVSAAAYKTCDEMELHRNNAVLFPMGALVMAAIMANSMFHTLVRKKTKWRGRVYSVK